jgi:hypothetical protein
MEEKTKEEQYNKLKVVELQALLREKKLAVRGKKAVLIQRLLGKGPT